MSQTKLPSETRRTNVKSTIFSDGMVVSAGDLDTAMRYPVDLFQVLIRAYFGCGVVCGLRMHEEPKKSTKTFCVTIEPGVALDRAGHPLQICEPVTLNLEPDPCSPCGAPEEVCIAIRRDTTLESPRNDGDSCGESSTSGCQYGGLREGVLIQAFPGGSLPAQICKREPQTNAEIKRGLVKEKVCECLRECEDCGCCGESWVLIGCVKLGKCGITEVHEEGKKYVKPIHCGCPPLGSYVVGDPSAKACGQEPPDDDGGCEGEQKGKAGKLGATGKTGRGTKPGGSKSTRSDPKS